MQAILKFSLSILLVAFVATPAAAQSTEAVQKELEVFLVQNESLSRVSGTLSQMAAAVSQSEFAHVAWVMAAISNVRNAALVLSAVSTIYAAMIDPRDATYVRRHASLNCKSLELNSDKAMKAINEAMVVVRTSVAVPEIIKVKEIIQQMSQSNLCKLFPEQKS